MAGARIVQCVVGHGRPVRDRRRRSTWSIDAFDPIAVGVCVVLFLALVAGLALRVRPRDRAVGAAVTTSRSRASSSSRVPRRAPVQKQLLGAFAASVVVAIATAWFNPFAVLVPMLPLGLVGLWGARHGTFPPAHALTVDSTRADIYTSAMADTASERIRVEAPAGRCLDVALDFESYPEWARDVREAKVLETDAEGRGAKVEFRAAALGKSIRYVLEYDYSELPDAFSWKFVEGDMLRRLDGTYRFEAEGPDSTRVHYELTVELAVPLPGLAQAPRRGPDHGQRAEGAEEAGRSRSRDGARRA